MKIKLTLSEKLRDLREERKMIQSEVETAADIGASNMSRYEKDDEVQIPYQTLMKLANFFGVSMDYLCGLTNHRQYRNVSIDELNLTDEAVAVLKSKKANNRLISELLAHPDFPQLLNALEIYIDRKIQPQMNTMNALYKAAETMITENFETAENDEIMTFLREAVVNEDEYLRFRISERFNAIMKSLFEAHKKDALSDEQTDILSSIRDDYETYKQNKNNPVQAKLILFAKNTGINLTTLNAEQMNLLSQIMQDSEGYKRNFSAANKKRRR